MAYYLERVEITEQTQNELLCHYKDHEIHLCRRVADDDWYITVRAPNGMYAYDGWWENSAFLSSESALAEAFDGALLDEGGETE